MIPGGAFAYREGRLLVEDAEAGALAERHGTPLYVYSRRAFLERYRELDSAFGPSSEFGGLVCYSVKVMTNGAVIRELASAGAGFDVVSGGELFRVLRAGGDASKVCFAGVAKTDAEIDQALRAGIMLFTVESEPELLAISARARVAGVTASAALRVNPGVDARTHAHVTTATEEVKFGVDPATAGGLLGEPGRFPGVVLDGLHVHLGSQITEVEPYVLALERLAPLFERHRSDRAPLRHVDLGGGFAADYRRETGAGTPGEFARAVAPLVRRTGARLVVEPGRCIAANSGALLARVVYVKCTPRKRFVIVDAAMNDLLRPALYGAFHAVWPVRADGPPPAFGGSDEGCSPADVVGGICESADFLAKDAPLPDVRPGDLLAVFSAGAYGFAMSSQYNSRPRAAEVLVEGGGARLIRRRETLDDLVACEEEGTGP